MQQHVNATYTRAQYCTRTITVTSSSTDQSYSSPYEQLRTRCSFVIKRFDLGSMINYKTIAENSYVLGQTFCVKPPSNMLYITKDIQITRSEVINYGVGGSGATRIYQPLLTNVSCDGKTMQGYANVTWDDSYSSHYVEAIYGVPFPVSVSQGTILNWVCDNTVTVNVNKSTAMIPLHQNTTGSVTYINITCPTKYNMFFDYWTVTYTDKDGNTYTHTTTDNKIKVDNDLFYVEELGRYVRPVSMNIVPIYSANSGYIVITLKGGCYIAYCDKMYKNISQKTAYVERGSTLIICPKPDKEGATWFAKKIIANADTTVTLTTAGDDNNVTINVYGTRGLPVDSSYRDRITRGIPVWYNMAAQKLFPITQHTWNMGFSVSQYHEPQTALTFSAYPLPKNRKIDRYIMREHYDQAPYYRLKYFYADLVTIHPMDSDTYTSLDTQGYFESYVNPDAKFVCITYDIDGNTKTYTKQIGEVFEIKASPAPAGYEFYKWDGDTQYIGYYQGQHETKYMSTIHLSMPSDNVILRMLYKPQGAVIISHVILHNGKIRLGEYPSYTYVTEGEFTEDTVLTIVADPVVQEHWLFSKWGGDIDSIATVTDIYATTTTITVPNYDVELTREIMEHAKYTLALTNGEVAGSYYAGDLVSVYYSPPNGNPRYVFSQWTGDISKVTLQGGGAFDPTYAGTPNNPQVIVMPEDDVSLVAEYTVQTHTLTVINGTGSGLYAEGDPVSIQGTAPSQDVVFLRWDGDISYIVNPFVENTQVIMPGENITVAAIYVNTLQSNDIGYTMSDLSNQSTVDRSEVIIISGTIQVGFVITDCLGNIYAAIAVSGDTITIQRLVDSLLQYNDIGYVATDLTNVSTIDKSTITVISGTIQNGFVITDSVGGMYTVTGVSGDTITIQSLIN